MKMKKLLSLTLVMAMSMTLAVPAMAAKGGKKDKDPQLTVAAVSVDKIEDEDDPRLPLIEAGAEIDTSKYAAIYIKQANDVAIIVPLEDGRSDADIIAEARASDKSLAKEGKGAIEVIRGDGEMWLHKNRTTLVTVENGILTVMGPISHIGFVGGDAPTEDELGGGDDDGTVSAVFQITKYLTDMYTFGAGFTFKVVDDEGEVVAIMTSNADGIAASDEVNVAPGQYTIRETGLDLNEYETVEPIVVTVDENGNVFFPTDDNGMDVDYIVNYELGALDVTKPVVKQEYDELWHTPVYEEAEGDTRVSRILSDLPDYITGDTYSNNGHTYLSINAAALANDPDGATIRIAKSDKNNTLFPDIAPENPWEDSIPLTYNLKIVDNELVVTSTLPNFGFAVYGPNDTVSGNKDFGKFGPKHESDAENPQANTFIKSWNMPEIDTNGNFRFLIHYGCPGYTTSEVIGCNPGAILTHECERVIDAADVTVTVTNAAGQEVTNFDKLPHGEYTVTVSVGDEVIDSRTVPVNPGETTTVTYDEPLYMEKDTNEYYFCKNPDCDKYVGP